MTQSDDALACLRASANAAEQTPSELYTLGYLTKAVTCALTLDRLLTQGAELPSDWTPLQVARAAWFAPVTGVTAWTG